MCSQNFEVAVRCGAYSIKRERRSAALRQFYNAPHTFALESINNITCHILVSYSLCVNLHFGPNDAMFDVRNLRIEHCNIEC